jgi:hypothetical protein
MASIWNKGSNTLKATRSGDTDKTVSRVKVQINFSCFSFDAGFVGNSK